MIDIMNRKEDEGRWVYIPNQRLCTGQVCTDVRASESFSGAGKIHCIADTRRGWEKEFVRDCSVYDHSFSLFADVIR
jgi:hypothetical protein